MPEPVTTVVSTKVLVGATVSVGTLAGAAAYGVYRGWGPITVAVRAAMVVFVVGSTVCTIPVDEFKNMSHDDAISRLKEEYRMQEAEKSPPSHAKFASAVGKAKATVV